MSDLLDTVWTLPPSMRGVTESRFYLSASAIDSPSPWTGQRTPYGPFLQVFIAELTFPPAPELQIEQRDGRVVASWREWQGFLTRLRGTSGKIRVPDSFRLRPYYDIAHAASASRWSDNSQWSDGSNWSSGALPPFVMFDERARADDTSFVVRGLPTGIDGVISPGDLIEARPNGEPTSYSNLYEAVLTARSNSSGKARVYVQPGLRQDFAAGDVLILREPHGVFRLADKDQGLMTRSVDRFGRNGMKLIEQLRDE